MGSPTGSGEMSIDVAPAVANADAASQYSGAKLTYYGDGVGIGNQLDETLAKAFTEATGIQITVIPRPEDSTETYATYQRAFEAKSGEIDVMMVDVIWPGAFAPHLADLTDAFSDVSSEWYESIVENNTIDGKLIGAPWFGDFGILYYRTDLLEQYGFDGPPATWDELEQQSKTIMEGEKANNPNFWGFVFQGKAYEGLTCDALEWIASSGGGKIIEDGKVTLDNDNAKAILAKAGSWIGTIAPTGVTGYQEEDARNAFQGGNAAFMRNWPYAWALAQGQDSAIRGKVGVAALPAGPGGRHSAVLGGWQLAVSKFSAHPKQAAALVLYLTSRAEQKRRAIAYTFNPTMPSLFDDPQVLAAAPFLGRLRPVFADAVARPSSVVKTRYNEVSAAIWTRVHAVLTGEATAAGEMRALSLELRRIGHGGRW